MGDDKSKGFFHNVHRAELTMLSAPGKCSVHLEESMVDKAKAHKKMVIDESYVCGLNAMRCCLLMKGYPSLPEKDDYPYTWVANPAGVLVEFPIVGIFRLVQALFKEPSNAIRMGPKPAGYADWMENWCSDCAYKTQCSSWNETTTFIQQHLRKGHPVIALGSESFKAHYFPIVGWGEKLVFVLGADGSLYWAHKSYIEYFMDVRIVGISGYSVFAME